MKTVLSQRLVRHFQKTDMVLLLVCGFAIACGLLAHWLSGEKTLILPRAAPHRWPVIMLPLFLWLAWIVALMIRRGYRNPLKVVWRLLRRDPLWLIRVSVLFIVVYGTAPAYSAFKLQIPQLVPFYADTAIVRIEAMLFGQDPWRLTHAIFGLNGTIMLDRLYIVWFPVSAFLLTWAIMTRDRIFQARAITTMFFVWFILGSFSALALSSCGPVYYEHFYGDDRFAPLMSTLRAYDMESNLAAIKVSDWLISDDAKGKMGSGISAMPSLHVGMTFLTWLFVQSRIGWKNPISAILGVYVALIWIASVHLAWHYWLDGAVSILGAAIFWKATGYFLPSDCALQPALAPKSEYQPHETPRDIMVVEPTPTVQP